MSIVTAVIDDELAAELDQTAASKRASRSELIDLAIQHYLQNHRDEDLELTSFRIKQAETSRAADAVIRINPHRTLSEIKADLEAHGIERSKAWIAKRRNEIIHKSSAW